MAESDSDNDSTNKNDKVEQKHEQEKSASELSSDIWKSMESRERKSEQIKHDQVTKNEKSDASEIFGNFKIVDNNSEREGSASIQDKNKASQTSDMVADTAQEKISERSAESTKKLRDEIAKHYGLEIRDKDGRYEFMLKADGTETVLVESDSSPEGLKEIEKKLAEASERKIKELEETYKVTIKREGEEVTGVGRGEDRKITLTARTPTFRDLAALESALKRSPDVVITNNPSKPLEVSFVKEDVPMVGYYNEDDNKLFMFTSKEGKDKMPPTPADAERERRDGPTGKVSLQEVMLHELAHHSQYTFSSDSEQRQKEYSQMGWTKVDHPERKDNYELLGKDGYQYEMYSPAPAPGQRAEIPRWYRKDADGNYIDKDGKKVNRIEDAHSMDQKEMREEALRRPPTTYYLHPFEMQAEMLTQLRAGTDKRGVFLRDYPELYANAKETDQRQLDSLYGKREDGTSKMIRMPDGTVAENNKANQDKVKDFESCWPKDNPNTAEKPHTFSSCSCCRGR